MTVPATHELFTAVRAAILATYGERLVAVAVFGSWAHVGIVSRHDRRT